MKHETLHMLMAFAYLEGVKHADDVIDANDRSFQLAGKLGYHVNKAADFADVHVALFASMLEPNE